MSEHNCSNCGNTISETDKFCDQCGKIITPASSQVIKKAKDKHATTRKKLSQFANHLEFLGYSAKFIEPEKENEILVVAATHEKNNNFLFWEMSNGFIFFQITPRSEKQPSVEVDLFVNQSNQLTTLCRVLYFIEKDGALRLRFEAVYSGEYSKTNFNSFYQLMENDQRLVFTQENFSKLFA